MNFVAAELRAHPLQHTAPAARHTLRSTSAHAHASVRPTPRGGSRRRPPRLSCRAHPPGPAGPPSGDPGDDKTMHPTFGYTWQDVLDIQMKALQDNDQPYHDHGIEVCYRFAAFDPWSRSTYFGRSMDLGQFERFRRIFSSPYYRPLLGWVSRTDLSTIADGEDADRVVTRMAVEGRGGEGGTFQVTLVRRVGGRDDGYWYVDSWLRDDGDWNLGDNMIL